MLMIKISIILLGFGLIFRISDTFISWIRADCEDTEPRLKIATINLNYFSMNEAILPNKKIIKLSCTSRSSFEPGASYIRR